MEVEQVSHRCRQVATFAAVAVMMIAPCTAEPLSSAASATASTTLSGASVTSSMVPISTSSTLKPINQAALQSMVSIAAKDLLVPGAVILLRTPQGNFTVDYGTTQLGTVTPPGAQTHFRIASNTKTMTAAIVMQLAQEKKLSLSDPISKYVSGVPDGANITIAELLEMRSGLYNYTDDPEFSTNIDREPTKVWTVQEVLAIAFRHQVNSPPGKTYEYNNTNYALLGLVIEKADGKPLSAAMQDRLFGPLGMTHTMLPASTSNTIPNPYSHGYLYGTCAEARVSGHLAQQLAIGGSR